MRLKSGGFRRLFRDCRGGATLEWASKLAAVLAVSGGIYVVGHAGGNRIGETDADVSGVRAVDGGDAGESLAGAGWGRADDEACRDIVVPVFGSIWASEWFKCAFQEFQDNEEFQYVGDTLGMTDEQLLELLSQITVQGTIDFVVNVTPKIIDATPGLLAQGWNWLTTNSVQHIASTVLDAVIVQPITFAAGMVTGTYENGKEIVAAWSANDGRRAGRAAKSIATGAPEALVFLIFDANDYKDMAHLVVGGGHMLGKLGKRGVSEIAERVAARGGKSALREALEEGEQIAARELAESTSLPYLRLVARDGVPVVPFGPNSVNENVTSIAPYVARREREAAQEVMQLAVNDVARPATSSRPRLEVVPRSDALSPSADTIPRNRDGSPMGMCFTAGTEVHTAQGLAAIETVALGNRVLTTRSAVAHGAVESVTAVDASWRRIELEMEDPRSADGRLYIAMLRAPTWVEATRARIDAMIDVDLQEIQVRGPARVTSIGDAPHIEPGVGRVVLMTVESQSSNVMILKFRGTDEVLTPTWGHRLFSLDRNDWIQAGKLRIGERLRATNGEAVIASITHKPGTHTVYNFEVETEHEYLVGKLGVQSHNDHDCGPTPTAPDRSHRALEQSEEVGGPHAARAEVVERVRARYPDEADDIERALDDVEPRIEAARGALDARIASNAPNELLVQSRALLDDVELRIALARTPASSRARLLGKFVRNARHGPEEALNAALPRRVDIRDLFLRLNRSANALDPGASAEVRDALRAHPPTHPELMHPRFERLQANLAEARRVLDERDALEASNDLLARSRARLDDPDFQLGLARTPNTNRTRLLKEFVRHAELGPDEALRIALARQRRAARIGFEVPGEPALDPRDAPLAEAFRAKHPFQSARAEGEVIKLRARLDDARRMLDERAASSAPSDRLARSRARLDDFDLQVALVLAPSANRARILNEFVRQADGGPEEALRAALVGHRRQVREDFEQSLAEHAVLPSAGTSAERGLCFTAQTKVHAARGLITIESVELGDRVLTTRGAIHASTAVDSTWHRIELEMEDPRSADGVLHIAMLRPSAWVDAVRARVGAMIEVDLHEMQVRGLARVTSIGDAPHIEPGVGRVVLMTVQSESSNVLVLKFRGTDETLEPTFGHRLFSLDRNDWIEAGKLHVGDRLRSVNGDAVIASIGQKPGTHAVYNFEVEAEHEYLVGEFGVQSHNDHDCGAGSPSEGSHDAGGDSRAEKLGAFKEQNVSMDWLLGLRGPARSPLFSATEILDYQTALIRGLLHQLDVFSSPELTRVWTDASIRGFADLLPSDLGELVGWAQRFSVVQPWALEFIEEGIGRLAQGSFEAVSARVIVADVKPGSLYLLDRTLQQFAQQFGSPLVELLDVADELRAAVARADVEGVVLALGSAADASGHGMINERSIVRLSPGLSRDLIPDGFAHEVGHYVYRDAHRVIPPTQFASEQEFIQRNLRVKFLSEARAGLFQLRAIRQGRMHGLSFPADALPATPQELDGILSLYDAGNIAGAESRMLAVVSRPSAPWREHYETLLREWWQAHVSSGAHHPQ